MKRIKKIFRYNLYHTVYLVPEEDGGYYIYVAHYKGIISQGDTKEEAVENIKEAILLAYDCGLLEFTMDAGTPETEYEKIEIFIPYSTPEYCFACFNGQVIILKSEDFDMNGCEWYDDNNICSGGPYPDLVLPKFLTRAGDNIYNVSFNINLVREYMTKLGYEDRTSWFD